MSAGGHPCTRPCCDEYRRARGLRGSHQCRSQCGHDEDDQSHVKELDPLEPLSYRDLTGMMIERRATAELRAALLLLGAHPRPSQIHLWVGLGWARSSSVSYCHLLISPA